MKRVYFNEHEPLSDAIRGTGRKEGRRGPGRGGRRELKRDGNLSYRERENLMEVK